MYYEKSWHCRKCGILTDDDVERIEIKIHNLNDFLKKNTGGVSKYDRQQSFSKRN